MSLLITLAPIFIYAALCAIIFIVFRRKSTRAFAPRTGVVNSLGAQYVCFCSLLCGPEWGEEEAEGLMCEQ
jgi:hypothetical protein